MNSESNAKPKDLHLINGLDVALQKEKHNGQFWIIALFFISLVMFVIQAYNSPIEEVARGRGSIIPNSREQVVQNLDPDIITEILVREGDTVEKDQVLLKLDGIRSSVVLREGEVKVQSLEATVTHLKAEIYDKELSLPKSVSSGSRQHEHVAYVARRHAVTDATSSLTVSKAALDKEIEITAPMVVQEVVSEVELLRMRRQSSELTLQITERRNRYMADANNKLVQVELELTQVKENMATQADPADRSQIRASMRDIVKDTQISIVGGVVNIGQDVIQIVPLDDKLLVEVHIRPQDIAFIRPGLPTMAKVSAYDCSVYGDLNGKVTLINPDTVSNSMQNWADDSKLDPNQAYYCILVQTTSNSLKDRSGKGVSIIPSMMATVDVKTNEKTVFQYLIEPIARMKQALSER